MRTSQVCGHHDKMARTKTHGTSQNTEYTKTHQTLSNNYFLCFSEFFFLFSIFNYLKDFAQKLLSNQFSAAANLTFSQHFLEEKNKKNVISLFLTRPLRN